MITKPIYSDIINYITYILIKISLYSYEYGIVTD